MIRRIRGDKEKSVYSSISTPNRTKAELHNKKEGTEGGAPRGDKGGKGDQGDKGNKGIGDRPRL